LSLKYGRPVRELQQQITSREFTELQAFIKRNTLSPDLWWSIATSTSVMVGSWTGESFDPKIMIPGQVDLDALNKKREQLAEKAMDREAKRGA
jgi:hypothetical protein